MKNGEFRIKVAIIATLIAFMGLFGTYKLYTIYNIEKPLLSSIQTIPEVEQASLTKKAQGQYEINIKLDQVANIQAKYEEIDKMAQEKIRNGSYEIKIDDNRNASLNQFYDYAQLAVLQASADNQFLWLNQTLQQKAENSGVTCSLRVDEERIYIQARDGKSYLYIIMPHQAIKTAPEGEKVS